MATKAMKARQRVQKRAATAKRISRAGIEAMTSLTKKITIEPKGIWKSVTATGIGAEVAEAGGNSGEGREWKIARVRAQERRRGGLLGRKEQRRRLYSGGRGSGWRLGWDWLAAEHLTKRGPVKLAVPDRGVGVRVGAFVNQLADVLLFIGTFALPFFDNPDGHCFRKIAQEGEGRQP